MTVRRIMGIETEYGITVPGRPDASPMLASGDVVTTYAALVGARPARSAWDYTDEFPLRDARGFDLSRIDAHPSQLTDVPDDPTMANVVLTNGARLYVDHAHPEYSSPEVTNPRDLIRWDKAGDLVMRTAADRLATVPPGVNLYKNNTDGKGASYGTHENYLMRRSTPFAAIVRDLTPFFVVRQILCGSGRVGLGIGSTQDGFQISQRADFFEAEVGLETTLKRPIINTRDEPHADADSYRRLHVILGDANHLDVSNLLKVGTTSLVLAMIEDGWFERRGLDGLWVRDPVPALRRVSHDPRLQAQVDLADGRTVTGLDLLEIYRDQAAAYLADRFGGDLDDDTTEVMTRWGSVLDTLRRDPRDAAREVEWVAKLVLLEAYRERGGLGWAAPALRAIDIQWSDVRAGHGLAHRLATAGRVEVLVPEEEAVSAMTAPPPDTRAWFRGTVLHRFPERVAAASWDSIVFDTPGAVQLRRVPMPEPLRGTQAHLGDVLDAVGDVDELLAALAVGDGD